MAMQPLQGFRVSIINNYCFLIIDTLNPKGCTAIYYNDEKKHWFLNIASLSPYKGCTAIWQNDQKRLVVDE